MLCKEKSWVLFNIVKLEKAKAFEFDTRHSMASNKLLLYLHIHYTKKYWVPFNSGQIQLLGYKFSYDGLF